MEKKTSKIKHYSEFWKEETYEGSALIYRLIEGGELPNVGVDYVEVYPGKTLEPHFHHLPHVIILILEGTGVVHLDGEEYTIQKGDIIRISPETAHGFRADEKLVFLSVQTPPIYGEEAKKDTIFIKE